jgi:hypothetical protein
VLVIEGDRLAALRELPQGGQIGVRSDAHVGGDERGTVVR